MKCSHPGCDRERSPKGAKGLCTAHYKRMRAGIPLDLPMRPFFPRSHWLDRFWKYVDRNEGECWPWIGALDAHGYGQLNVDGKPRKAHRLSYEVNRGPINPPTLEIRHLCHNPRCVNPDHLAPGSHADNMRDKVSAGRSGTVPREVVVAIRRRYDTAPRGRGGRVRRGYIDQLAVEFGVSRNVVKSVALRKSHTNGHYAE